MKFKLTIDCDNAAFGDTDESRSHAIADMLSRLADGVQREEFVFRRSLRTELLDTNGNTIGWAVLIREDKRRKR